MLSTLPATSRRVRRSSIAARLEMLETRTLLSAITSYQVGDIVQGGAPVVDANGDVWVPDAIGQVEKIHKNTDGTLIDSVFPTGGSVNSVAYDATNGHIYVANQFGPIQELDLNGNILNSFSTADSNDSPLIITAASDGAIWFTTAGNFASDPNQTFTADVGRMTIAGNFSITQIPIANTNAIAVSPASDGSVWFGSVGIDNPITPGLSYLEHGTVGAGGAISLAMYTIPQSFGGINSVTVAADNSIWYSVGGDDNTGAHRPPITEEIGHATVTGSTLAVTEYTLPKSSTEGDIQPGTLALDNAGRLWFTTLDSIDYLDTATGDFTRMNPNNGAGVRNGLAISATDVWVGYNGGNNNTLDVALNGFTAPIAATSPDISSGVGQPFSGTVAAFVSSDAGNFAYTINFGNGTTQTGTLANNSSGVYTINGTTTYAAAGTYNTSVTITSDAGDVISVNGQATVASATVPLVSQGVNLQAERGIALAPNVSGVANVVVAQFSGPAATYSATIQWGDSTSTVAQIVSLGSNQYYVELPSGTSKSYAAIGTYNVSVVITDGTNTTTATSTATISAVPLVASQNLVLQPLFGGIVLTNVATFTADTSSTANWFRATINWGDGSHSSGLVIRTSAGHYTILGLHIYSRKGTYAVTTSIVDSVDIESALGTATIKIK